VISTVEVPLLVLTGASVSDMLMLWFSREGDNCDEFIVQGSYNRNN